MEPVENSESVKELIELKFCAEQEYSTLIETFNKVIKTKPHNVIDDLDIYSLRASYINNIETYGNNFLENQKTLITQIDSLLMQKCHHNWINDVIEESGGDRNICYCSKCYVYAKK